MNIANCDRESSTLPEGDPRVRLIHLTDFVRRPDDKALGTVVQEIGRAYVVVQWPNGTQSKHHQRELRKVC